MNNYKKLGIYNGVELLINDANKHASLTTLWKAAGADASKKPAQWFRQGNRSRPGGDEGRRRAA
mgnify:CR=1 FL=1